MNASQRYPSHWFRSVLSVLISGKHLPYPLPWVIPDWRRLQRCHPSPSQIGVGFSDWSLIGVGSELLSALSVGKGSSQWPAASSQLLLSKTVHNITFPLWSESPTLPFVRLDVKTETNSCILFSLTVAEIA
jgi:hypothetical protein